MCILIIPPKFIVYFSPVINFGGGGNIWRCSVFFLLLVQGYLLIGLRGTNTFVRKVGRFFSRQSTYSPPLRNHVCLHFEFKYILFSMASNYSICMSSYYLLNFKFTPFFILTSIQ